MEISKVKLKESDQEISRLAASATRAAYRRAASVGSVVVFRRGKIRRILPDGSSEVLKSMPSRTRIAKGSKFKLATGSK